MGLGGKRPTSIYPHLITHKAGKIYLCLLIAWLLYRTVKLGVGVEGKRNEEDGIPLSSLCKWSACRMYIEMPYKTKQTHKVVRTLPISQFSHSETHTKYRTRQIEPTC